MAMIEPTSGERTLRSTSTDSTSSEEMSNTDDRFFTKVDCWNTVFDYLDYKSRARCERSCKILFDVIIQRWKMERFFDINDVRPTAAKSNWLSAKWVAAVIDVCGKTRGALRSIHMSIDLPMWAATFNDMVELCPKLERLDFFVSPDELHAVHFAALTNLHEMNMLTRDDAQMSNCHILRSNRQSPPMADLVKLTGLRGGNLTVDENLLRTFLVQHKRLTCFELAHCTLAINIFDVIAENCPLLRDLAVVESDVNLDGLARCTGLKKLNIARTWPKHFSGIVSLTADNFVEICSRNAMLESLRIAGRDFHLVNAFQQITMLTELEELEIECDGFSRGHLVNVFYAMLRKVLEVIGASLRRLSLKIVSYALAVDVSDRMLEAIAMFCPNLRVFVLRTDAVFSMAALEALVGAITKAPEWAEQGELELFLGSAQTSTERAAEVRKLREGLPAGVSIRGFDWRIPFAAESIVPIRRVIESAE